MWDMIADRTQKYDPDNAYSINYMWGTTGIGYNVKKVQDTLGIERIDSWDVVFKPEMIAKTCRMWGPHARRARRDGAGRR